MHGSRSPRPLVFPRGISALRTHGFRMTASTDDRCWAFWRYGSTGGKRLHGHAIIDMPHRLLTCPDDSVIFPHFAYFKLSYAISDPKIVSISPNMKIQMLSTFHPLALRPSGHARPVRIFADGVASQFAQRWSQCHAVILDCLEHRPILLQIPQQGHAHRDIEVHH